MDSDSFIYSEIESKYFDHPAKIISLDYYKPDSAGEDDFSRKQVWFYVYGDEEIKEEFTTQLTELFEIITREKDDWDIATLMPTHVKEGLNRNMEQSVEEALSNTDISYRQILRRNQSVKENHNLNSFKEKVINIESSIDIQEDVEGKNIIVVDNIALTGCSFMNAVEILKENGANKVLCISLGTSSDIENSTEFNADEASQIFKKLEN